ncbi:hypothetical protein BgiBS90_003646 [Biomphalaria glabrata]|nr:hypothetical protein BgiBS90_003646 [Biomphalaria glabrata]
MKSIEEEGRPNVRNMREWPLMEVTPHKLPTGMTGRMTAPRSRLKSRSSWPTSQLTANQQQASTVEVYSHKFSKFSAGFP